jgi:hypothetical protein
MPYLLNVVLCTGLAGLLLAGAILHDDRCAVGEYLGRA